MKKAITIDVLRSFGIPAVEFLTFEKCVSQPIPLDDLNCLVILNGKLDRAVLLEDGTVDVEDYKTTSPTPRKVLEFSAQLHSYALALESPAKGQAYKVSQLGVTCFDASEGEFALGKFGGGSYQCAQKGRLSRFPIELDMAAFAVRIHEAARIAMSDVPPEGGSHCETCNYLATALAFERSNAKRLEHMEV